MRAGPPNLVIVADDDALARVVAEHVVARGNAAIAARGAFFVSLAGGSTPKAAYALLAAAYRDALDWASVRFFFGDERCVPPDDDDSNFKMANARLFEPLGIAEGHVFRIRGEDHPAAAAAAYAETLRNEVPQNAEGTPVFDLVMLGMGPDGHTASLFPGSDPFADDGLLVRAPFVEKFGTHRITLTPRVLNAASEIDVATAGPTKTAALAAVLEGPYDPSNLPAQVLDPHPGRLSWLVDTAAAAGLSMTKPA